MRNNSEVKNLTGVSRQEIHTTFNKFEENSSYYHNNIKKMREKYGGEFIAIINKDVVAHDENPEKLSKELDEKFDEEERRNIYTTYVSSPNKTMMV